MEEEAREQIKKLLNDYYGNVRDDSHKEEIIDFIINYSSDIEYIVNDLNSNQ